MNFIKILAERENGFIYHQKIPDVLPELGEMKATHGLAILVNEESPQQRKREKGWLTIR